MTTYSALTIVTGQSPADALALALEALEPEPTGVGVFEVEDGSGLWEVGAYFTDPPDVAGLAVLGAMHGAADFNVSEIPDQDWVAKVRRDLPPVEAGRFFVYGSHDADKVPDDSIPLLIEAAMAFGTGHHGTTLGCLLALNKLVDANVPITNVADIGCGTAVLAMAAARITDSSIIASDIDPVAIDVTIANLAANRLSERIDAVVAAGFDAPALKARAPFDLVFANILKGPLIAIAEDMARATAIGGHVILSGILNEQADAVVAHYSQKGFNLISRDSIVDWTTLTLARVS